MIPSNKTSHLHISTRILAAAFLLFLAACSNLPKKTPTPAPSAASAVSLDEWLERGDTAIKGGDHAAAREAWRSAARSYPSAKQPWLKLSEDYFDAADYGNAVLSAQEALQRDPKDRLANSVLAVSGLRLTAGSLAALREDGGYPVGSRNEAVSVTRALREALGEPVLVPPADSASAPPRKRPVRTAPRSAANAGGPGASAAPAPSADNPLDKLK